MWLFGNENKHEIKKLKKIADCVIALEDKYKPMTDEELKEQTDILKKRLSSSETLDDILPDAYAVVREAGARVLNMRHFYVQILGGIALHQGRIAEMATGEGKTLVATLPAYLNALTGKGVHVVTVNEYLAKRDSEWMGKLYKFLGLSVGFSMSGMNEKQKKDAYACDITYCTNNELGFDYLRDNMAGSADRRMLRGLNFAIVDEVDSILIDEARTPLIISGRGMKSSEQYKVADRFAKTLKIEEDFEIDIKTKQINLTDVGVEKAEKYFHVDNLSDVSCIELNHHIMNALKANYVMICDENYIVKDDKICIVDEFTGRLMDGRRFSDGLHQAIEAKEGVAIKDENKTLATITFQNFFRLYTKLSGMTGTAKTEEAEFRTIYNLDVVTIPSNLPNIRRDESDIVFTTENGKFAAIVEEVKLRNKEGQPVLIGTVNIDKSEKLSSALRRAGIKHVVLNAKNHENESNIIAQAGRLGAVTIATNMAGRGTDILLGGNPEFLARKRMEEQNYSDEEISYALAFNHVDDEKLNKARDNYKELLGRFKKITDEEKEKVRAVGGLHVIGTERHESRRIDNQLRGRAARQGDPGSSVFFLSLEDDLIKRFGGEKMQKVANFFKLDESTPIQLKMLTNQIENAQKKIENQNFAMRKTVLQFDDVLNVQRTIIYNERNKVLDGIDVHKQIMNMIPTIVIKTLSKVIDEEATPDKWDIEKINTELEKVLLDKGTNLIHVEDIKSAEISDLAGLVEEKVVERYNDRMNEAGSFGIDYNQIEKIVMLKVVDTNWMNHIDDMQIMKNEIFSRGFGNQDPVIAYKKDGYEMFDNMIEKIREETVIVLLNTTIQQAPTPKKNMFAYNNIDANTYNPQDTSLNVKPSQVKSTSDKVGRNDMCPCGSGKKYKNCCGKNTI